MGDYVIVITRTTSDLYWVASRFGELVAHYQFALRLHATIDILARDHRTYRPYHIIILAPEELLYYTLSGITGNPFSQS